MLTEPLFDYYGMRLTGDVVSNAKDSGSLDDDDFYYPDEEQDED
jgi:hypothetical protein